MIMLKFNIKGKIKYFFFSRHCIILENIYKWSTSQYFSSKWSCNSLVQQPLFTIFQQALSIWERTWLDCSVETDCPVNFPLHVFLTVLQCLHNDDILTPFSLTRGEKVKVVWKQTQCKRQLYWRERKTLENRDFIHPEGAIASSSRIRRCPW